VDKFARRAIDGGATLVRAPSDEGHGERQCRIRDPFGHEWLLGHQVEDISSAEIQRRLEAEFKRA
jgi:PhnB protein